MPGNHAVKARLDDRRCDLRAISLPLASIQESPPALLLGPSPRHETVEASLDLNRGVLEAPVLQVGEVALSATGTRDRLHRGRRLCPLDTLELLAKSFELGLRLGQPSRSGFRGVELKAIARVVLAGLMWPR